MIERYAFIEICTVGQYCVSRSHRNKKKKTKKNNCAHTNTRTIAQTPKSHHRKSLYANRHTNTHTDSYTHARMQAGTHTLGHVTEKKKKKNKNKIKIKQTQRTQ